MGQLNSPDDVMPSTGSPTKYEVRRRFLARCMGLISSLGLMSFLYPVIRYIEPPPEAKGVSKVEIDLAELPTGAAKVVTYRGRPALVVNGPDGFVAFMATCSHLGCAVKWVQKNQEFICPCHGGRFDIKGQVTGGPPPVPLVRLGVSVIGDKVVLGA